MQLEDGKKYRAKNGQIYTIKASVNGTCKFFGTNNDNNMLYYTETGNYWWDGRESFFDLVEEVIDVPPVLPVPEIELKVGKFYNTTAGDKIRLLYIREDGSHIFLVGKGELLWSGNLKDPFYSWFVVSEWKDPVKVEFWINIYQNSKGKIFHGSINQTLEISVSYAESACKMNLGQTLIDRIHVVKEY